MKKSIILLILLSCTAIYAQEFELAKPERQADEITITVEGVSFEAFISPSGAHYIMKTSKADSEYKFYFGYDFGGYFEGKKVYSNKEMTKFWILGLTKSGNLKKIELNLI